MNANEKAVALEYLHETTGCVYALVGNKLQWLSSDIPKPTVADLEKAYQKALEKEELEKYKVLRKAEYPPMENQLDTIFHKGIDAWKAEIQAIKDKYPKPAGVK